MGSKEALIVYNNCMINTKLMDTSICGYIGRVKFIVNLCCYNGPYLLITYPLREDGMQGQGNDILTNNSKGKFSTTPFPFSSPSYPTFFTYMRKQNILPNILKGFHDFL